MYRTFFSLILSLIPSLLLSQQPQQKQRPEESLVRLIDAKSAILTTFLGREFRKISGPAQFLHNGALILCDSAIWDTQANIIDAIGNVKIIQKNTTLSSDNIKYLADQSLAQVRGQLVELLDKEGGRLRTHYIDYYTKDSIGMFYNGGCLMNKDSSTIESTNGYYYAKEDKFTFQLRVEMKSDSVLMTTDSLTYLAKENRAVFLTKTFAWQGDGFLIAHGGWYDRNREFFHFAEDVYIKTKDNEIWAKELDYDRKSGYAKLEKDIQILDTAQSAIFFADYATYNSKPEKIVMERNPSVATYSDENGVKDTLFFSADTILYNTLLHKEVDSAVIAQSSARYLLSKKDPIKDIYGAKKLKGKNGPGASDGEMDGAGPSNMPGNSPGNIPLKPGSKPSSPPGKPTATPPSAKAKETPPSSTAEARSKKASNKNKNKKNNDAILQKADSTKTKIIITDSLIRQAHDTLATRTHDTLVTRTHDSLVTITRDTLLHNLKDSASIAAIDSTAINPLDTVSVKFLTALKNVKFYRSNLQGVCDSLQFNSLDSLIRLFKDPVLWNENKQLSSDSIQVVIAGRTLRKAELNSSAFVAVEEDSTHFDQIKSADVIIFFEKGELSRFDALGSASMLFFFAEDSVLTTMNEKECKAMSARLVDKNIEKIHYYEGVTSNAHPLFNLAPEKQKLKGFRWLKERRPKNRYDVCNRIIKVSQAYISDEVTKPVFVQYGIYFPKVKK